MADQVDPPAAPTRVRVALDVLGGERGPQVAVAAVAQALAADGDRLAVLLVGPPDPLGELLAAAGLAEDPRVATVPAAGRVAMDEDPVRAVRARRTLGVRVAAETVRAGRADACVSAGHTGACVAASLFALGRLPGVTRPALAVVLPALGGPVVLLDCGAGTTATPDLLAQFALAGAAYAQALGRPDPRVGLLTIGGEPGKGDPLRRDAQRLLSSLPIRFAGPVEGHDVATGGPADVVVTDGFTGNVLLKGIEGAVAWAADRFGRAYGDQAPARAALRAAATQEAAGGILLGVSGVSVIAHGTASATALAGSIGLAARAVRHDLVPRTAVALADLVARRRAAAGLPVERVGAGPGTGR